MEIYDENRYEEGRHMEVFVGRQPIFDAGEQVIGYELLYRNAEVRTHSAANDDDATVQVLANALLSIGIDEVAKGKLCFVNFTENLLMGPLLDYLPPEQIGIEVLEDVPITAQLIERLATLKQRGFKISMDDFVLQEETLYANLFSYIDFVKVDFLTTNLDKRTEIEQFVLHNYPQIKLVAERVETRSQFDEARICGYSMFQGFFFEQPQLVKSYEIPINTLQYLQVLAMLKDKNLNMSELATQIERDVSLSFKLMQFIRVVDPRLRRKVSSIKQAIIMLGITELRKWMYLLAIREMKNLNESGVFKQLMIISLFRARVCEQVARKKHNKNFSEYFLVGMFSLIDSLLQRPLQQILVQMPLADDIIDTLVGVETEYSPYLKFSIALAKLKWDEVERYCKELRITEEYARELYEEAMTWAESAVYNTVSP